MQIGIGLPTRVATPSSALLLEWAARADRGPFSSVAVVDRVVAPMHEPLTVLAAVAGVTQRVRLMASVLTAPTHETTLLARQAATIDSLSGGRLSLGLGVGTRQDDYLATGFPFGRRGRRFDEQLATLRLIWSDEPLSDAVGRIGPRPVRSTGPEVLIGQYVPAVARRIALWGDGFAMPDGGERSRMLGLWDEILTAWTDAGRPGRPRWVAGGYFALGAGAEEAARAAMHANYAFNPELADRLARATPSTRDAVVEAIETKAEMGVDEYILRPVAPDMGLLDRLAEIVTSDVATIWRARRAVPADS
jgi:alkanesulfonate monooxygenase SsuD/methylene tetrahydromethanopterin reductase-like flavin-dependent oxidoreductase (luciferase family)